MYPCPIRMRAQSFQNFSRKAILKLQDQLSQHDRCKNLNQRHLRYARRFKSMHQSAYRDQTNIPVRGRVVVLSCQRSRYAWHMTQLTFSSNFYWNFFLKFCILEQIIATVLFICISSINNKRSLLRLQWTTAPTNRGWSACAESRRIEIPSHDAWRQKLAFGPLCYISERCVRG